MKKQFPVELTPAQRNYLQALIGAGVESARLLTHARILLKADQSPSGPGWTDVRIAEAVEVSQPTVARIRRQWVEEGLEASLRRRAPTREYVRKLDGAQEARLVAITCGPPPEGQTRWSLRLLADRLVELEIVDDVSYQTVRRTLKKRPQALASAAMVYPARGQRRIRLAHGGCAGGLYPPV
jgi:hypothetical protein